jgi:diguanylate cyclase (GGDEF)-like protein
MVGDRMMAGGPLSGSSSSSLTDGLAGAVLDALPDATAVLDDTGLIVAVNRTWHMFALDNGATRDATGVGVNYLDVCTRSARAGSRDAAEVVELLRAVIAGESVEADFEYPCPSPVAGRWFLMRITRLSGAFSGVVVSHVNITRRKAAEKELAHAASHDPLTGLANRLLLQQRLATVLRPRSTASVRLGTVGVVYIDLDGFKAVNDTYGHGAGDEVLLTIAHRLRDTVRAGDTAARLGGDEFAVLAPGVDAAGLAGLAGRIERCLAEPHRIHGDPVPVTGSLGTHLAQIGDHPGDALRTADEVMYVSKRAAAGRARASADTVQRSGSPVIDQRSVRYRSPSVTARAAMNQPANAIHNQTSPALPPGGHTISATTAGT